MQKKDAIDLFISDRQLWNKRQIEVNGSNYNDFENEAHYKHDFTDLEFCGFDFTGYDLRYINFTGSNLESTHFTTFLTPRSGIYFTYLYGVNFCGTNLKNAHFISIECCNTNFSYSNLKHTFFNESILKKSNFSNSNLTNVNYYKCAFHDSNFSKAIFNNTKLIQCNLSSVTGLSKTVHKKSSYISFDTVINSNGAITDKFLKMSNASYELLSLAKFVEKNKIIQKS